MASRLARHNAYVYCALRDRQYARYDRHAKDNGISMREFLVVNVLFYAPDGMSQSEVCARTFNSRQTVSLVVKRLEARGFASSAPNPGDRRNSIVSLTDAGRAWAHDMVRTVTRAEDEAMARLTKREQEQLVSLSRRFTEALVEFIDDPAKLPAEDASPAEAGDTRTEADELPPGDGAFPTKRGTRRHEEDA